MLESNGLLDCSPLMGMAYLCDFATSGTPIKLSKREIDEIADLPSSDGISRFFNQISPIKSLSVAASDYDASNGYDKSSPASLIAAPSEGLSNFELLTSRWSTISHASSSDMKETKRRKLATESDLYAAFLSYAGTPNEPKPEQVSENRAYERKLPWDIDDMDFPVNTPTSCQSFSFLRDVVYMDETIKEQMGGDQKSAAGVDKSATVLYTPVCSIWSDDEKQATHIAIDPLLVLSTTGSPDSSQRQGGDELKWFPSHAELSSLRSLRSQQGLVRWYERFRELLEFKRLYGHYNVPQKFMAFPKLGVWVNKQRSNRHDLPPKKVEALESVGFDWGKKLGESAWMSKFNAVVDYKAKHGDCE
jgi:Helicase associated domain